jgi:hypothetical protein
MSTQNEYQAISKKLIKLREDKHELSVKIGQMAKTPRSDGSYSSASLTNWLAELEKLSDKEQELAASLAEVELDLRLQACR